MSTITPRAPAHHGSTRSLTGAGRYVAARVTPCDPGIRPRNGSHVVCAETCASVARPEYTAAPTSIACTATYSDSTSVAVINGSFAQIVGEIEALDRVRSPFRGSCTGSYG